MWCAGVLGALARVSWDVREVDGFGFDRGGVPEEFDDQPATRCCDESFAGSGDWMLRLGCLALNIEHQYILSRLLLTSHDMPESVYCYR